MNLQDVADRLGCSVKTVRRRIDDGSLPAARVARGVWVVTEDDLSAFIEAMRVQPRAPAQPIGTELVLPRLTPPRRASHMAATAGSLCRHADRAERLQASPRRARTPPA